MKSYTILIFFCLIQIQGYAKKCYCEDALTSGGHIGYTYNVNGTGGCCSGTASTGVGWITTWAVDEYGNEWAVNDDFDSNATIQSHCCTES
jgi:hypothetical protein